MCTLGSADPSLVKAAPTLEETPTAQSCANAAWLLARRAGCCPHMLQGLSLGSCPGPGMQKCSLFMASDQHRDKLQQRNQTCSCNTEAAEIPNSTDGPRKGSGVRESCLGRHTCTSSPPALPGAHLHGYFPYVSDDCVE